ncbi:MAG: DUF4157 domain-containing protein [Chloroflexi bacterium]|nr:DUF4157 domain-containing protein [Chloroflexota bacterium]MCI0575345.1 DUF4157 domain-containing protein [Chloroflexota bacterium]MCI0645819.1 DUF4157 domain-containing protein [Chloroflexota bacterium]MCI0730969.1 DUF4157 domain-containing protein [Chloroflexota bacterium]
MSRRDSLTDPRQTPGEPLASSGALQRRPADQSDPALLPGLRPSPERPEPAHDGPAAPRFGHDFSQVRPYAGEPETAARPKHSVNAPAIQRFPQDEAGPAVETAQPPAPAEPVTEPAEVAAAPLPGLIVEDETLEPGPGQMRKSEFLAELRPAVCAVAESALAGTGRTTDGCPYLDFWLNYYGQKDSQHVERAIHKYAPESARATTAREYIPVIAERVRQGVETWARTGEVTGVPEDIPTALPGEPPVTGGASAPVMAKGRQGEAAPADNPQAIQARLGKGRPLEGSVRSRMESAFGRDFGRVRVHADPTAAALSGRLNARAFTVGEDVAFGNSEYQPGTLVGDVLIAHELAHVVQQGGGRTAGRTDMGGAEYHALEEDADESAVGAVLSLWDGTKGALANLGQQATPSLKSGLRLQRCDGDKEEAPGKTTPPASEKKTAPVKEEAKSPPPKAGEVKPKESEAERVKKDVAAVKSLHIEENLKGAVTGAEGALKKAMDRRKATIEKALDEVRPLKGKGAWADEKIKALEGDLGKDLDAVLKTPDSKHVSKDLRDDVIKANEALGKKKTALASGEKAWHVYDAIFASDEVVKTLSKKGFTAADLKALVGQESGDLTRADPAGDIAGVAQMSKEAVEEVGCKAEDRLDPAKAIPCAAKVLVKKGDHLEAALKGKGVDVPSGLEYKKFVFASYNAGAATIATAAKKAKDMGRVATSWAELVKGGDKSPLQAAIKETLPKLTPATKYKETTDYVERILKRIP